MQDEFGLLKRRQLVKVVQELKEPQIPWQVRFADATKYPQVRLQQRKQALCPVFVYVPPRVFLLGVIDEVMRIALERPIAAGRVRIELTALLDCEISCFLRTRSGCENLSLAITSASGVSCRHGNTDGIIT